MNRSIILVPIHPPYFKWAQGLLDSASANENIGLVFSNIEEANKFAHPFPYKKIITDQIIDNSIASFINNKKLNALKQVQNDYDYIAIIDAEAKFIKDMTPNLKKIWDNNCFLANHSIDGARITKKIAELCRYEMKDDLYVWFNEPSLYKSSLLPGFFEWLQNRDEKVLIDNEAFDFILFAIYCRFELGMPWRILGSEKDVAWHGLNGDPKWKNYKHLHKETSWSTWFPGVENHSNIRIIFHLDRYPIK